jgi:hypothetical protein
MPRTRSHNSTCRVFRIDDVTATFERSRACPAAGLAKARGCSSNESGMPVGRTRPDRIENTLVLLQAQRAHAGVRAVDRTEQPLKNQPLIVFGYQRQGGGEPGERAAVGAAVSGIAGLPLFS